MQAFMLYMSGGGVQVFSMGIVFMLMFSPFKNVAAINTGTPIGNSRPRNPLTQRKHSFRTIRTIILFLQIIQHTFRPEDRLYSRQSADARVGAVQVQFDGSVTDGNRGLASVRDSGTGT